jgi:hypothetical protein
MRACMRFARAALYRAPQAPAALRFCGTRSITLDARAFSRTSLFEQRARFFSSEEKSEKVEKPKRGRPKKTDAKAKIEQPKIETAKSAKSAKADVKDGANVEGGGAGDIIVEKPNLKQNAESVAAEKEMDKQFDLSKSEFKYMQKLAALLDKFKRALPADRQPKSALYNEVRELFEKAPKSMHQRHLLFTSKAAFHFWAAQFSLAEFALNHYWNLPASNSKRGDAEASALQSFICFETNDRDGLDKWLQRTIDSYPEEPSIPILRGYSMLMHGKFVETRRYCDELQANEKTLEVGKEIAKILDRISSEPDKEDYEDVSEDPDITEKINALRQRLASLPQYATPSDEASKIAYEEIEEQSLKLLVDAKSSLTGEQTSELQLFYARALLGQAKYEQIHSWFYRDSARAMPITAFFIVMQACRMLNKDDDALVLLEQLTKSDIALHLEPQMLAFVWQQHGEIHASRAAEKFGQMSSNSGPDYKAAEAIDLCTIAYNSYSRAVSCDPEGAAKDVEGSPGSISKKAIKHLGDLRRMVLDLPTAK